jgi:protein TonB
MTANGFLEQKQASPLGFGTVVLLHGAAIAAVVMIKGPGYERAPITDTTVVSIEKEAPPPPPDPEPLPDRDIRTPPPRSVITAPPPLVPTQPAGPTVFAENTATQPGPVIGANPEPSPSRELVTVPPRDPPRNPVRVDALFDPRFAGSQQPPYPSSEERAEREGEVRIRVTIGADGRVTATQRLAATSDAFWRATESQARNRWRFRPATVDGRPVQASKVITIHFRLDGR